MKKFLNLALVALAVLLMSSCSTIATNAVTSEQTTTTTIESVTEPVDETVESRLFEEEILEIVDETKSSTSTTKTNTIPTTTTTITPAPASTTTPTTTATPTTAIVLVRTPTGVGQSLDFQAGDTVVGWKITFSNGESYEGGVVVYNSPFDGTVVDGVINPWPGEITNQTVITP